MELVCLEHASRPSHVARTDALDQAHGDDLDGGVLEAVVCAWDGIEGMERLHGSAKPDAILLDVTDSHAEYPPPPHTLVLRCPARE
jgi:hypothetical protein